MDWKDKIKNDKTPTQLYYAKGGVITPQMEFVAKIEGLEAEFIRSQIAQGKLIIPANTPINRSAKIPTTPFPIVCDCNFNCPSDILFMYNFFVKEFFAKK